MCARAVTSGARPGDRERVRATRGEDLPVEHGLPLRRRQLGKRQGHPPQPDIVHARLRRQRRLCCGERVRPACGRRNFQRSSHWLQCHRQRPWVFSRHIGPRPAQPFVERLHDLRHAPFETFLRQAHVHAWYGTVVQLRETCISCGIHRSRQILQEGSTRPTPRCRQSHNGKRSVTLTPGTPMASVLSGTGTQCPVSGQCADSAGTGVPSASQCLAVTAVCGPKVRFLKVNKS
jgi:hypothetical protein